MTDAPIRKTALENQHVALGAKMVNFHGWWLPLQYQGVLPEHHACRSAAGLFDVSHMGQFRVQGKDSEAFLQYLLSNDVSKTSPGKAMYAAMCNHAGGTLDDLVFYRLKTDEFLVVVNASNREKDWEHFSEVATEFEVSLADESDETSLIAIQGRRSQEILQKLVNTSLDPLSYYTCAETKLLSKIPALIARTGYTGEDGFEIYIPWNEAPAVWDALLEKGRPFGLAPCGLGARDTLRTEMGYALYGNELNEDVMPIEAGLGWVTKFDDKGDFIGRDALLSAKERGSLRTLVGFRVEDRRVARGGNFIFADETDPHSSIGVVTSGTHSPTLNYPIGMALLSGSKDLILKLKKPGSRIFINVRDKTLPAEVVKMPFYKRPY